MTKTTTTITIDTEKPAKAKRAKKTHPILINVVVDESGSMSGIADSVRDGLNEYVNGLKKDGNDYRFTLTTFDSRGIRIPFQNMEISQVPKITHEVYTPVGMTPLYDAVCQTIQKVEREVSRGQSALVVIMTDGFENSSKEFTEREMKAMIERLTATDHWTFTFMGANMDSFAMAHKYGIQPGNTVNWTASNIGARSAFSTLSQSSTTYASAVAQGATSSNSFYGGVPTIPAVDPQIATTIAPDTTTSTKVESKAKSKAASSIN